MKADRYPSFVHLGHDHINRFLAKKRRESSTSGVYGATKLRTVRHLATSGAAKRNVS